MEDGAAADAGRSADDIDGFPMRREAIRGLEKWTSHICAPSDSKRVMSTLFFF